MHMVHIWASHDGKTPLLCAAEAGHDEIVAYLLQFRKVQAALEEQPEKVYSASVSLHTHNFIIVSIGSVCRDGTDKHCNSAKFILS